MKLVFFGSPPSAVVSLKGLLEKGHNVELVVTQPDKLAGRGKKLALSAVKQCALEHHISVYQPARIRKNPQARRKIQSVNPDLNVVVAYGQIIPASIIYYPLYNSINLHFSLLPKYRGASPVQWAILKGEQSTGVTVFELNEKMDEGDILAKKEVEIFAEEYAFELEKRLSSVGAELLCETIKNISAVKREKQDHSQATYAPRLKKTDGKIDWAENSLSIERKVRACTPWPSAFTFLGEKRLKIIKGRVTRGKTPSAPGEIAAVHKKGIEVACGGNNFYLIEELQPEGKKSMSAYAFSLGAHIKAGDRFV